MGSIEPTETKLAAMLGAEDDGKPLVMINLLRYRDRAAYKDGSGEEPCSGREAYLRYGTAAGPCIEKAGAEMVAGGAVQLVVIGPDSEEWDDFFLVRYPNKQAFIDMVSDPEYQAIAHHRTAALADSRLVATCEGGLFGQD